MGLTIHYNLTAPESWTLEEVHARFEIISDYARHLACANVSAVLPAHEKIGITDKLHKVGRGLAHRYVSIAPEEGWVLMIDVGEGCEPLVLGLCKYPASWRCQHGRSMRRWHPTNISSAWQFSWFCKTQFAGKHGSAHFVRCHKIVISLLDFCRKGGMEVTAQDEAGYWENRNDVELLKKLRKSEAMLAAFGGFFKDKIDRKSGRKVESPIFDYANFEHLEHEGWQCYGNVFANLKQHGGWPLK